MDENAPTPDKPQSGAPLSDADIRAAIDAKTKPLGALGRLETLAAQIARIQQSLAPRTDQCRLFIFAADHGVAGRGVSAYPQAVTRQMALNFLAGGAAANAFAAALDVDVSVVDAGIAGPPIDDPRLISRRIGDGTADAIDGPAMTHDDLDRAIAAGRDLAAECDADALCLGEMGIGNTSSASLIAAKHLGRPVAELIGRGTGLDDDGLARKRGLLEEAAGRTPPRLDGRTALAEYGGFEIAMMSGAMIGAADTDKIVIVDGFIAAAAALSARALAPGVDAHFVYAHRSAEPGHAVMLGALGAQPLLDLGLRLGEGTGALLAWPLVKAAAAMLRDMASFESAGVSGRA